MNKFLAVVKREYIQRVRTKFFVVATILGPVMMVLLTVVPALMFSIKAGGPTRLAIVDQSGKMYSRLKTELANDDKDDADDPSASPTPVSPGPANVNAQADQAGKLILGTYELQEVSVKSRSLDEVTKELDRRVLNKELDGYVVLPQNILADGQPEFHGRNTADVFTRGTIQSSISRAVRSERLAEAKIPEELVRKMSEPVRLKTITVGGQGGESNAGQSFYLVFAMGLLIYMTILLYGQLVLGAIIEEKETRIAEILFSSMRSFPLMMGKLIGVALVALTQLSIWGLAVAAFTALGVPVLASRGVPINLHLPPILFVYFLLFFLLGFFIYASVYALVGSMVTTTQEGGQLALPIVFTLVAGFWLSFSIIRAPNSSLAFWASMFPFFAPITMLVRIVTETPPAWQIALSFAIGVATILGLLWLTSRVYRVGMLMYGKKASIPEAWRWIRQA